MRSRSLPRSTQDPVRIVSFLALLGLNGFLSYYPLPLPWRVAGMVLGFLLLLVWVGWAGRALPLQEGNWAQKDTSPSPWAWGALFLLAVFLRLYRFQDISVWPMWDDAYYCYFPLDLSEKWHWQFFFGSQQYMPVYTWLQALFFRVLPPSLLSLWLYPVLYSLLVLPLVYLALRRWTVPRFAFLYFLLFAIGFWPLYLPKFSTDIGLGLVWQFGLLYLLGPWWKDRKAPSLLGTWVLGLAIGIGWYLCKFSVACLPLLAGSVLYWVGGEPSKKGQRVHFLAAVILPLLPMAWAILSHHYGTHLWTFLSMTNPHTHDATQALASFSYITGLFWGSLLSYPLYFHFGPLWGGLLNPVLGSFFGLGLVELYRSKDRRLWHWTWIALVVLLGEGLVSNTVEFMRIAPILPLLFFIVTVGLVSLLSSWGRPSWLWALPLLALSLGLDLHHLWGPYRDWATPGPHSGIAKPPEQYRAFPLLEKEAQEKGPGLVLTDLAPDVFNQTLTLAAYPFNAARNPRLSPEKAAWAGVMVPATYHQDFQRLFPGASTSSLSEGLERYDQALDLWIIPVTEQDRSLLLKWTQAHQALQSLFTEIPYGEKDVSYHQVIEDFFKIYPLFKDDPFLESIFCNKVADFAFEDKDAALFQKVAEKAVGYGHAPALLHYHLGLLYQAHREERKAQKEFNDAQRLDPRLIPPTGPVDTRKEKAS